MAGPDTDTPERVDIVDEDDRVIGAGLRDAVHAAHAIHRGIHVFVTDVHGQLLLQRRATTASYYPGYWDASVGGHVRSGESYVEAAHRELAEELGLVATGLDVVGRYDSYSSRQREKRTLFAWVCDRPPRPAHVDVAELRFVNREALARMLRDEPFTEGFLRSLTLWTERRA